MTACVNKKHTRRVALAISASLVGALSLGAAAPAVAFAEGGVSTLATEDAAVSKAEVEYRGEFVSEFTYNGRPQGPVPTKVTPVNEDTERVAGLLPADARDREKGDFYYYYVQLDAQAGDYAGDISGAIATGVEYVKNDKGDTTALTGYQVRASIDGVNTPVKPEVAGKYAVVVGQWNGASLDYVGIADTFEIVGQTLDNAVLCDGLDATDVEFNYTGENNSTDVAEVLDRINVALDGRVLEKGKDYTLELWTKGAKKELTSGSIAIDETYVVKVIGASDTYKGQVSEKEFTLGKLDLASATILGNVFIGGAVNRPSDATTYQQAIQSINGIENADINWNGVNPLDDQNNRDNLSIEFVSDPDGSQTSGENTKGYYTFKLVASSDNKNVEGEKTFTVAYANYKANVDFANTKIAQPDGTFFVDAYAGDPTFDLDDIVVSFNYGNSPSGAKVEVPAAGYTVTVFDAEGNKVEDMSKPGTYTVRVDVDYDHKMSDGTYAWVAGSDVCTVVVQKKLNQATDVFLSYDGQNIDERVGESKTYNGSDHVPHFAVKAIANGEEFVEGQDYEVVYQKVQDDGKVVDVDSIVDAGYYNVVVRGITFQGDYVFQFDVTPVEVKGKVQVVSSYKKDGHPVLAWTGDVLTPGFRWDSNGDEEIDDSDDVIPSDAYEVEYVRDVDDDGIDETVELKDVADDYTAYLETAEGVVNYDVDATAEIEVTDAKVFSDVPSAGEWFSEYVYKAAGKGYMTGYNLTTLFGPNDTIKRGDVAVTLYKMAGGTLDADVEGSSTSHKAYETGFGDVDSHAYYAQAIQWAKKLGIVTGYDGTDSFAPEAAVSRQELATMLARYAKVAELDAAGVDVDESKMDAYTDAGQVAAFAEDSVAWAVSAGVMGQDVTELRPADAISRAEVAAMTVRVQPDGKLNFDDMMDPNPAA